MKLKKLHNKAIDKLKELGAKEDLLCLVEVQTIDNCAAFYGDYVNYDLCRYSPEDHDSIIYFKDAGEINQHATFSQDDPSSFKKAIISIAKHLGADIKKPDTI